ncbi:MAG: alpha/beta hydrolase [Proteobacteria bacterium]|nr:alpha/beta hydrolase [Pseudomonadota bacterium]
MVTVYFATNRARVNGREVFGDDTIPGDAGRLAFGSAEVALTPKTAGAAENKLAHADHVGRIDVFARSASDGLRRPPGSSRLIGRLQRAIFDQGKDLLIYIHGYDTTFREAVWYGAQIKLQYNWLLKGQAKSIEDLGGRAPQGLEVLVFSWPSAGKALAYPWEFGRITQRGWHLGIARLLTEITTLIGGDRGKALLDGIVSLREADLIELLKNGGPALPGRLHVLAQSMGARMLGQGFDVYASGLRDVRGLVPLFQTVLLTGADVDADAFESGGPLEKLPQITDRTVVYYNEGDFLGLLSGLIWGKARMSRRGLADPSAVPAASDVDVTAVIGGEADPFGHYYARMNERVIADILYVMGDTPPGRITGRKRDGYRNAFALEP